MNVLVVNNGTIHFSELLEILKQHKVTTVDRDKVTPNTCENFDLVILSGGNHSPVVKNPDFYKHEIQMIKSCKKPIIGICMGFELIAYAYGAELKELEEVEEGEVELKVQKNDKIFSGKDCFKVYEHHRWVVSKVKEPLVALARSKDGVEIIKHKIHPIYGFQFHPEVLSKGKEGFEIFSKLISLIEYWVMDSKND